MARQKESAAAIRAKGKSHISKKDLENREKKEPKVNLPNTKPPGYLTTKEQRNQFNDLAQKLKTIGESFFTELDVDTLARYVLAREQYVTCNKKLRSLSGKGEFGSKAFESALRAQSKAFDQCRACASDLGLSVTSRCRIEVPQVEQKPKENRFSQFAK